MSAPPDFVESLGMLTVDHRFKRMMHRLLGEAGAVYRALGLPVKGRWCSTLLLLEREGGLTVTEVAERVRLSHPAVVQILDDMAGSGLVEKVRDPADGRRRLLSLTPRGRRWMPRLHGVWDALAAAQTEAFAATGCDVLAFLDAANAELDRTSIAERVLARLEPERSEDPSPPVDGGTRR